MWTHHEHPPDEHAGPRAGVLVSLRGIAKVFPNGTEALRGFDLDVQAGEFLSLLGPSGCGKSTALRVIAALTRPSAGSVEHATPGRAAGAAGQIGFVFQEATLMPWATVAANVGLPLRLLRRRTLGPAPSVEEALALVGLTEFSQAYPRELSGGMKMRVSIARALVTGPSLLLLDEPFAALDEITRFRLNNDLLALWQSLRKTVVFVTHSVFESVYLSSRIVVMAAQPGRVFTEIPIPVPYPRDESFRTSSEYAALCRTVSQALARAMREDGA